MGVVPFGIDRVRIWVGPRNSCAWRHWHRRSVRDHNDISPIDVYVAEKVIQVLFGIDAFFDGVPEVVGRLVMKKVCICSWS